MTDNTTRVIKLANGESIVCTCIPTRTDEGSDKLHVIQPLKMELKNRITKKGVVEALSLSRWLQPFTESDEFDIEKSTITKVDAKTNKTVEITSIIDAKIDPTIKSSTKVLENQDYSHLDFGEPINYEFTNLMIRNIPEFEKEKKRLFENPEIKHSVDNEPWITVEGVPAVAKIGDKIKVRFSKEIKNIDISIGN